MDENRLKWLIVDRVCSEIMGVVAEEIFEMVITLSFSDSVV